jgi:hypothetical protein
MGEESPPRFFDPEFASSGGFICFLLQQGSLDRLNTFS